MASATPHTLHDTLRAPATGLAVPVVLAMVLAFALVFGGPTYLGALVVLLGGGTLFLVDRTLFMSVLLLAVTMRGWIAGGERIEFAGFDFDLGGLVSIAIGFVGVAHLSLRASLPLRRATVGIPYLLLLAWLLFSFAWSPHMRQAVRILVRFAAPFAVYMIVADLMTPMFRKHLKRVIYWSSAIPIAYGLVQWGTGSGSTVTEGLLRVQSCFVHPAVFSMYLVVVLTLAYADFVSRSVRMPIAWMGYMSVVALLQIATFTRVSWAATLVVFVYLSWVFGRRRYLFLASAALAVLLGFTGEAVLERVTQVGLVLTDADLLDSRGNSIGWRILFWKSLLEDWQTSPLVGHGAGASILFGYNLMGVWSSPHNGYLRLLHECGIIGLGLFVWLLAAMVRSGHALVRRAQTPDERALGHAGIALALSYMVLNLTDNILEYYEVACYLWAALALVERTRPAETPT